MAIGGSTFHWGKLIHQNPYRQYGLATLTRVMSNLSEVLLSLGYGMPATIVIDSIGAEMWLVELGASFDEFSPVDLTSPQSVEEEGLEIKVINAQNQPSQEPTVRQLGDILGLLKELSGKKWCLISFPGPSSTDEDGPNVDLFLPIEQESLRPYYTFLKQTGEPTLCYTMNTCEVVFTNTEDEQTHITTSTKADLDCVLNF